TASSPTRLALTLDGKYDAMPVQIIGTFGGLVGLTDPTRVWSVSLTAKAPVANVTIKGMIQDVLHGKGLTLNIKATGESVQNLLALFHAPNIAEMGPFEIAGTLTDNRGTLAATELALQISVGGTTHLRLAGTIQDIAGLEGVDTRFSIEGNDVADLEPFFKKPLPFQGAFHMTAHALKPAKKPWRFVDLAVTAGKSVLKGSADLDLNGERPQLAADLSFQVLDLRPFLSRPQGGPPPPVTATCRPEKKREKVFSDTPFSFTGLQELNATVDLRVDQTLLPWLVFDDLTARAVLHEGHLQVRPFKGTAGDGTVEASVDLEAGRDPPKIGFVLNTHRFDLGQVLKTLGIEGVLEGKLDVEFDLAGQGNSVAALMASLNGTGVVVMDQGKINDRMIGLLRGGLKDIIHMISQAEKQTKYTQINCLVVGLDITQGLVQSTALVLDTSDVTLSGHGEIDLATEGLDVSLKPTPKKGVGIKGLGKLSLSLGQLTKPLKLGGTLANPSVAIDASGTMLTLGKAIGGVALLGPVGLAAALAGGKLGNQDPCAAAVQAAKARSAQPQAGRAYSPEKGETQDTPSVP
ncbi:MAG: AsmA family protein, partial [Deltaproteobacteria bacterium]|nr:AsmA family protein [Deltaproteobacteria bacterium]